MKKQTKQNATLRVTCCSTRQRVWGIIALVGLFACGFMIGYAVRRPVQMTAGDPAAVAASMDTSELKPACAVVEEVLLNNLAPEDDGSYQMNLYNADIYSRLVENGCPENSEKFKALARRQMEIAKALVYDYKDMDQQQTETVIDTYKRLDMQREAQQFLDKVQKITNPAIDFILQMQQIINE